MYIWFDMDGTITDLYGQQNWLEDLIAEKVEPYLNAEPLYAVGELLSTFWDLKLKGYNIGIISWCAKNGSAAYNEAVKVAKNKWLKKLNLDILIDKVIITKYGKPKHETCKIFGGGILVDDEPQNINNWTLGKVINAKDNILTALASL